MRKVDEIQAELNELNEKVKSLEKKLHKAKIREKRIFEDYPDVVKIGEWVKDKIYVIRWDGAYGGSKPYDMVRRCAMDLSEYLKMKEPIIMMMDDIATIILFDGKDLTKVPMDIFKDTANEESELWTIDNYIYYLIVKDKKEDDVECEYIDYKSVFNKVHNEILSNGKYYIMRYGDGYSYLPPNQIVWSKYYFDVDVKQAKKFLK